MPLNIQHETIDYKENDVVINSTRQEQIETLQAKLSSPSTPEGLKESLQNAIARIEYRPRSQEVIR